MLALGNTRFHLFWLNDALKMEKLRKYERRKPNIFQLNCVSGVSLFNTETAKLFFVMFLCFTFTGVIRCECLYIQMKMTLLLAFLLLSCLLKCLRTIWIAFLLFKRRKYVFTNEIVFFFYFNTYYKYTKEVAE